MKRKGNEKPGTKIGSLPLRGQATSPRNTTLARLGRESPKTPNRQLQEPELRRESLDYFLAKLKPCIIICHHATSFFSGLSVANPNAKKPRDLQSSCRSQRHRVACKAAQPCSVLCCWPLEPAASNSSSRTRWNPICHCI